jgi:hypothetical protein
VNTRSIWYRNNLSFIDQDYSPTQRASLWESCPQLAALDPAVAHVFFDDFYDLLDGTTVWIYTEVGAGGAISQPDGAGGICRLTSDALDNDSVQIQKIGEAFKLATGKPLWFEARVKLVTAAKHVQSDILVGLAITDTTLLPIGSLPTDGVYFRKDDATDLFGAITNKNSTETATAAVLAFVAATFYKFGIFFDGAGTVYFYVDGVLVATHTTNIPDDEELTPSIAYMNGEAGACAIDIDYVKVVQIR